MCLTIPKKIIKITGNEVIVETPSGDRQNLKSIVDLEVGDYCLSQQGIITQKIDNKEAEEILNILEGK